MTPKLLTETVLSVAAAAEIIPRQSGGKPPHVGTLGRWIRQGIETPCGPVKLEACFLAGKLVTSKEAVARFLAAVANAKARQQHAEPVGAA